MAFVYILKSVNFPKTYVGSTIDLEKRIKEHNQGQSNFTSRYNPWKLIYHEKLGNLKEARIRERYFKSATGRRFIKKLFQVN